jgi:hypothetical protein
MANAYKVLGQLEPSATTLSTLYTVPSATSAVCSTMTICNLSVSTTVRVAVRPAGEAINDRHYIVYDQIINANDSIFLTLGISLAATDVVSVFAGTAMVSFGLYGTEIS